MSAHLHLKRNTWYSQSLLFTIKCFLTKLMRILVFLTLVEVVRKDLDAKVSKQPEINVEVVDGDAVGETG